MIVKLHIGIAYQRLKYIMNNYTNSRIIVRYIIIVYLYIYVPLVEYVMYEYFMKTVLIKPC